MEWEDFRILMGLSICVLTVGSPLILAIIFSEPKYKQEYELKKLCIEQIEMTDACKELLRNK